MYTRVTVLQEADASKSVLSVLGHEQMQVSRRLAIQMLSCNAGAVASAIRAAAMPGKLHRVCSRFCRVHAPSGDLVSKLLSTPVIEDRDSLSQMSKTQ